MRSVFGASIDDEAAAEITAYLATNYATPAKPWAPDPIRDPPPDE
jgi:hypothetical protein